MDEGNLSEEQRTILTDAKSIWPNPDHEEQVEIAAYRDEVIAREQKRLDARLEAALNARADDAKQSWWHRLFK